MTITHVEVSDQCCVNTPGGHSCGNPEGHPVPCHPGQYQNDTGMTSCKQCADGYYTTQHSTVVCTICPGSYSCPDPAQPPQLCKAGEYSDPGSSGCFVCPPGTAYTGDGILHSCTRCGYGEHSNGTHCLTCPVGYYCPPLSKVQLCPLGTYQDQPGEPSCKICPVGHSCLNVSVPPVPCTPGFYSHLVQHDCVGLNLSSRV
ncbi:signal peptide, CUB and EGF-like domain-containing protein 1 [Lingula anatina]|uniref:Signal peptide, CUB and EGF-like domain-containing protein 1 n=1 Tax=Lingula anatina TaxID=7574 RepID=A0A1S3IUI1_LINAN|nr:signal peptide, CUB and EGF-like domain-containing protein 1 [Lingula anatina]|eukprot:XP_013401733.2 signal peptide, CUB and EGF-like domain-containing protein 1 [Lingula anatina]